MNKRSFLLIVLTALFVTNISAQTNDYCKGLKNPTAFTISGNNPASASWYGFEGSKNNQASACGNWGMTSWGTQINASQLESRSSGSSCTNGNSVNIHHQSDYMNRFVIKGSGSDPLTSNHLSYLPPDTSFTSSIRLGNNCGGTHEAEMICYQFDVRPQNALVFIWYALSLQNGQHSVAENPEFAIEIEKKTGTNTWTRIGHDTLCYIRPTPAGSGSDVSPFYVGSTGQQTGGTYGCNIYLPWNKVAINLNNYLYETVRIKVGAGDCSMSAHYACAYIAGECQAMNIQTSGCPAGATTSVQKLTAPTGLSNYVWYKSNQGSEGIDNLLNVDPSINFTAVTPDTSTSNVYYCQTNDFFVTEGTNAGRYTNLQVFRCDMTSSMNPDIPFTSRVYVQVNNTKPSSSIDTLKSCDADVLLTDKSYVPGVTNGCDTSISKWYIYNGSDTTTAIADSIVGGKVNFQLDSCGTYAVRLRSFYTDDHACYTDKDYTVTALCRPDPVLAFEPDKSVCVGETVILKDNTVGSTKRDWILPDNVGGRIPNGSQNLPKVFQDYKNPVTLVTYNGLYTRDSINTYDTIWCTGTVTDTVEVFQNPVLHVDGDTVVCNGQQTDVTVSTETEGCQYTWYTDTVSNVRIADGQHFTTLPYADTNTYYVRVISPKQCKAWCTVNIYRVNPRLSIDRHDMCEGDSTRLTASNAYSYTWTSSPEDSTLADLNDSLGHGPAVITVSPKQTTTYTVVGHGTNECNADPLSETITIHPVPVATIETDPKFVDSDNPMVTFTDASPYSVSRVWYFDDGVAEEYTSPCTHDFGEVSSDSVNITLVAYNDLQCSDTLGIRIPVTQFTFYAPNVFTPERPDNNTFRIFTANEQENFSVYIYDREGRQVYTSTDLHFTWNGNVNNDGTKCPQGSYAWVIRYRRPGTEDIVTQKGVVTLLR